jgi:hypothetical protein
LKNRLLSQKVTFLKFSREKWAVRQPFDRISSMFLGRRPNDELPKMFEISKTFNSVSLRARIDLNSLKCSPGCWLKEFKSIFNHLHTFGLFSKRFFFLVLSKQKKQNISLFFDTFFHPTHSG